MVKSLSLSKIGRFRTVHKTLSIVPLSLDLPYLDSATVHIQSFQPQKKDREQSDDSRNVLLGVVSAMADTFYVMAQPLKRIIHEKAKGRI